MLVSFVDGSWTIQCLHKSNMTIKLTKKYYILFILDLRTCFLSCDLPLYCPDKWPWPTDLFPLCDLPFDCLDEMTLTYWPVFSLWPPVPLPWCKPPSSWFRPQTEKHIRLHRICPKLKKNLFKQENAGFKYISSLGNKHKISCKLCNVWNNNNKLIFGIFI